MKSLQKQTEKNITDLIGSNGVSNPLTNSNFELTKYKSEFTEKDIEQIKIQLCELVFARSEDVEDYNFEIWIKYLKDRGFTIEHSLEILECGKDLTKYGKLAIGDLIQNWFDTTGREFKSWYIYKYECILKAKRELLKK